MDPIRVGACAATALLLDLLSLEGLNLLQYKGSLLSRNNASGRCRDASWHGKCRTCRAIWKTGLYNTRLVSLLLLLHSLCLAVLSELAVDWEHLHSGEVACVLDLLYDHLGTGPLRLHPLLQCSSPCSEGSQPLQFNQSIADNRCGIDGP